MADGTIGIDEPTTIDLKLDTESLTVGANTVQRERVQIAGAAATDIAVVDAANGLDVDVTRVIPGSTATALGKAEDAAHTSGDVGVMALGVRQAANAPLSGADLDYEPLQTDANGHLKVNVIDALPAGTNAVGKLAANSGVDIGDVDVLTIAAGDNNIGNVDIVTLPSVTIGTFPDNEPFNVAQMNGVAVSMGVGASGTGTQRVVQASDAGKTLLSTGGTAASSGNNTLVAAGTAKLKVYAFSLTTTSTTSVTCIFQSGASGTELWRVVLQAPSSVNTGANLSVSPPAYLFATASATLLNLNLSAAQTIHWSVAYFDEG